MPKLNGRPPKYRHHKATKRAYVQLDGRPVYLGRYDSPESWEKYHRLIGEWLANGRRLPAPATSVPRQPPADGPAPADAVLVKHVVLDYWRFAQGYYRRPDGTPSRELDTIRQALRVLRRTYGSSRAAEFGPKRLKAVRAAMVGKGWSRTHVNRQVSRLKAVFRWAVENEMVPPAVHRGLLAVRHLKKGRSDAREPEPVRPVAESHVAAVLPHVLPAVAAVIRLQLLTAMRPAEVVTMRGRDIDTGAEQWAYRPPDHKTAHHGKVRDIFLGAQAQEILRPYLKPDLSAPLFSPAEAERQRRRARHAARTTPLNQGNRPGYGDATRGDAAPARPARPPGDNYTVASYRRAIQRACEKAFPPPAHLARRSAESHRAWRARLTDGEKAELRQWNKQHSFHPNQLRHTAAFRIRRDFGLDAAQAVLGHSSARMTEHYAKVSSEKARGVMRQIG